MYKVKKMPLGISLFLVLFVILEIYYFFIDYFSFGVYKHYGYTIDSLESASYLGITLFLLTVVAVSLGLVLYGFIKRRTWVRKFTMFYIIWAALWPIWGIIVGNNVAVHVALFIIYVLSFVYLMTEYVKEYFRGIEYFTYGDYTLYKRLVTLKSGKILTIHFFSKKEPKSGTPTTMPDGYDVGINERSNMPYLQKIGKPKVYKYGDYTLYKRDVTLKSGKTLTIHFFSKGKPKSGKQTTLPDGYVVRVNERSGLPYLKKENKQQLKVSEQVTVVSEEEIEESKKRKPSNVIYVVSRPQPGQVRGDWAVRSHGKIYSHHRTKENAIKEARKVARDRDATVMIQKTDGTFSQGFKPKPKK